jgi:hypothetical protein
MEADAKPHMLCGAVARTSPCTDKETLETAQARRRQRTRLSKRCLHARTGRGQDEPRKQRTSTRPGGGVAGQYEPSRTLAAAVRSCRSRSKEEVAGHRQPTPSGNEPLSRHAMSWCRERGDGCTRGWGNAVGVGGTHLLKAHQKVSLHVGRVPSSLFKLLLSVGCSSTPEGGVHQRGLWCTYTTTSELLLLFTGRTTPVTPPLHS